MATPTRLNKKTYLGSNPVPNDNTDDLGGTPDTGTAISESVVGNLMGDIRTDEVTEEYYTIFYEGFNHTTSGSVENARFANRAGAKFPSSGGSVSLVSTNASDNGTVRITGKVSGDWVQEDVVLGGTTPVAGIQTYDSGEVYRWEYISGTPTGIITCSVASEVCAVIYGTEGNPSDGGPSITTYMATVEMSFALATSINLDLESTDRLTVPSDIGSFSQATYWTGEDNTITVPGGTLGVGDTIGVCGRFTAYAGIMPPSSGKIQFKHGIIGDATA